MSRNLDESILHPETASITDCTPNNNNTSRQMTTYQLRSNTSFINTYDNPRQLILKQNEPQAIYKSKP
jgi:hypothetical protein